MRLKLVSTISMAFLVTATIGAFGQASTTLDLRAVARLTLQRNPALAGAGASVAESEAAARKARGMLMPRVTAKSSYGYITKPTFFGATPVLDTNTVINRIEVAQPIYTGGQLQAAASAADYAARATGGNQAAVRSQVLTNSTAAYLRALQARDAIAVAQSSVKSLESSYDASKKLFDSGVVTRSDVLRAEVALTTSKEQLIAANNNHAMSLAALKTAIGLPQSETIELAVDAQDSILADVGATAARPRPEVAAAGYGVKAATYQLKAARGAKMPSIGVLADFENQPVGSQFPRLSNTAMVGVQIKFNVFDGGQTKADIDAAQASIAKANADLESVRQATEFQLETARLAVDSSKARVETLSTQVTSAEESFRVVEIGYREGINVINDVLSVESMLTQAKVSRLAAEYDLKIAELNLLLALGQTQELTN